MMCCVVVFHVSHSAKQVIKKASMMHKDEAICSITS